MLLKNPILTLILLGSTTSVSSATNLRSRKLRRPNGLECKLLAINELRLEHDETEDPNKSLSFECELDSDDDVNGRSNMVLPMVVTSKQKAEMIKLLEEGELVSDLSTLRFENNNIMIDDANESIKVPEELKISQSLFGRRDENHRRRLAIVEGTKPILVVRVTDSDRKAVPQNAAQVSDDVFGTGSDPVNLKSQMHDCSFGKLNIIEGESTQNVAPGVMEVTINIPLEGNARGTIRNAVTTEVQNKLGEALPGPYQQVMYVLEGCYQDCGWAAYAYVNSWNSVYQGNYYFMTGVQMHELGHNFNLAHSGGLNGATYTDHTGLMGNPLYSDDVGKMCWNAAKSWQIGWYDDRKELINPQNTPSVTRTIIGIADYGNNPSEYNVVLKIETGTSTDQFITFNRARGVNSQNDEADNEVTIVETGQNGEGYSQSSLKAHLVQGESFIYTNWAGTGKNLEIVANVINLSANPGYAEVSITLLGVVTPAPTSSPSSSPSLSQSPSFSPTTAEPSSSPSPAPTKDCSTLNESKIECNQQPNCTYVQKEKVCSANDGGGGGDGGGGDGGGGDGNCNFCAHTGDVCCGTCVDSGKPADRGCFA